MRSSAATSATPSTHTVADSANHYCCPWAPVFAAKRPVKIDGRCLRPLQQFTLDVSAEEIAEGGEFKRELLLGNFQPTKQIDYCDPSAGGHND